MRLKEWVLGAVFGLFATYAAATVVISHDNGGRIGPYLTRYQALRQSGEYVVVDGECLSACTIVLGIIPKDRLCVTPNAVFGFHAAWLPDDNAIISSREATRYLMQYYPPHIRIWITRNGGLTSNLLLLYGKELTRLVSPCGARGRAR
jgi:hypothetical protein